jgi:hypothetical protein
MQWIQSATEIEPSWQKWVSCGLLTAGALIVAIHSFYCAFGYRFQKPLVKVQRLKHG